MLSLPSNSANLEPVSNGPVIPASRSALIVLIAANVFVGILALTQQWGYLYILLVYWWEAVIIGGFNLARMFVAFMFGNPFGERIGFEGPVARFILALALGGFFVVKFGGFAIGLGFVILILPAQFAGGAGPDDMSEIIESVGAVGEGVMWAVLVLVVSHGISFFRNYIARGEYKRRNVIGLMFWPYVRLVLIVIVLLAGLLAVYLVPALAAGTVFTLFLVICKLLVDLASHRFEHSRFGKS